MKKLISIIFLDIDGVLAVNEEDNADRILPLLIAKGYSPNDSIPCLEYDQIIIDLFDDNAVHNLEQLIIEAEDILKHEIGIVLSSDWRLNRTVPFLQKLFKKFSFSSKIVDRTPQLQNASREEEIMFWLKDKSLMSLSNPASPMAHKFALISQKQLSEAFLSPSLGGISRYEYDIHSFVIIDDHDSSFSNHFPEQFVHIRNLFSLQDKDHALVVLKESFTHSAKAIETIMTFQPENYMVCEEEFESFEGLL